MCTANRQRDHLLQLGDPVPASESVRGKRQLQSAEIDYADITRCMEAHYDERPLHLPG